MKGGDISSLTIEVQNIFNSKIKITKNQVSFVDKREETMAPIEESIGETQSPTHPLGAKNFIDEAQIQSQPRKKVP